MQLNTGTRIGSYEILNRIGAGGMGEVYRARDSRLGRDVAIKILPPELAQQADRLARFENEARSSSALNHPNIVTIYEIGGHDSTHYIAMEFVTGKTLRQLLNEGQLPLRRILQIMVQVAEGLANAHASGITHRDLKPENIMVNENNFAKILDFGLAKLVPALSNSGSNVQTVTKTAAGTILGTVGYMSPEQAAGQDVDYRSDQFSFGVILYEMLTGKKAFQRATPVETLSAIIRDEPDPIDAVTPQTPPPIRWVIERCIAKDARERYGSTQDLATDLRNLRDHLSEISSVSRPAVTTRRRNKTRSIATGVCLVVIGALLGWAAASISSRTPGVEPMSMDNLTYSGHDTQPDCSPDGKLVAFASDRDGTQKIWLKELTTGNEVSLTSGRDGRPRFSPDGSSLAFVRTEPSSEVLYRVSILGGEPKRILENVQSLDWSPDGKQFVMARTTSGTISMSDVLAVSDANGTNIHNIYHPQSLRALGVPRWSPDGTLIAVTESSLGNNSYRIIVLDANSGKTRKVIESGRWLSDVNWLDADHLIYCEYSTPVTTYLPAAKVISYQISSDGHRVLFSGLNLTGQFDVATSGRLIVGSSVQRQNLKQLAFDDPGSGDVRWLTRSNSNDRQPAYSPDGEWVIFSSNRTGNLDLWKVSTKTGAERRLTDDSDEDFDPAFTPDGKHILWSSKRTGHFEIWMANADGSSPHQISNDGVDAENPTMTADQKWIVYNSYNPAKQGVWKIQSDGSGAVRLINESTELPEVSPDGRFIRYTNVPKSISEFIQLSDGKKIPFTMQHAPALLFNQGGWGRSRWTSDGKKILFIDRDVSGIPNLFIQNFEPGKDTSSTRRAFFPADSSFQTESFGVSPDGIHVTVSGLEVINSLMVAENVPGVSSQTTNRK